jgi:pimeloyl-ACP methyl ester carboxylesterase
MTVVYNQQVNKSTVALAYNVSTPVCAHTGRVQAYTDPAGGDRGRAPIVIAHGLFGQKTNWSSIGKALHRRLGVQVRPCVRRRAH